MSVICFIVFADNLEGDTHSLIHWWHLLVYVFKSYRRNVIHIRLLLRLLTSLQRGGGIALFLLWLFGKWVLVSAGIHEWVVSSDLTNFNSAVINDAASLDADCWVLTRAVRWLYLRHDIIWRRWWIVVIAAHDSCIRAERTILILSYFLSRKLKRLGALNMVHISIQFIKVSRTLTILLLYCCSFYKCFNKLLPLPLMCGPSSLRKLPVCRGVLKYRFMSASILLSWYLGIGGLIGTFHHKVAFIEGSCVIDSEVLVVPTRNRFWYFLLLISFLPGGAFNVLIFIILLMYGSYARTHITYHTIIDLFRKLIEVVIQALGHQEVRTESINGARGVSCFQNGFDWHGAGLFHTFLNQETLPCLNSMALGPLLWPSEYLFAFLQRVTLLSWLLVLIILHWLFNDRKLTPNVITLSLVI